MIKRHILAPIVESLRTTPHTGEEKTSRDERSYPATHSKSASAATSECLGNFFLVLMDASEKREHHFKVTPSSIQINYHSKPIYIYKNSKSGFAEKVISQKPLLSAEDYYELAKRIFRHHFKKSESTSSANEKMNHLERGLTLVFYLLRDAYLHNHEQAGLAVLNPGLLLENLGACEEEQKALDHFTNLYQAAYRKQLKLLGFNLFTLQHPEENRTISYWVECQNEMLPFSLKETLCTELLSGRHLGSYYLIEEAVEVDTLQTSLFLEICKDKENHQETQRSLFRQQLTSTYDALKNAANAGEVLKAKALQKTALALKPVEHFIDQAEWTKTKQAMEQLIVLSEIMQRKIQRSPKTSTLHSSFFNEDSPPIRCLSPTLRPAAIDLNPEPISLAESLKNKSPKLKPRARHRNLDVLSLGEAIKSVHVSPKQ